MANDDKIRDEKPQYDITREAAKISTLSSGKLINMNILQVKKYCVLIKDKQQNKLSLYILLQEKLWKDKQKRLKTKEKS